MYLREFGMEVPMNCPKCNSDNTQSLPMIYESGTSVSQSTSHSHGGGFFNILPTFRMKTQTNSLSQSVTAQKAAPPEKQKLIVPIVLALVSLLFTLSAFGTTFNLVQFLISLVALAVFTFLTYNKIQYNKKVWPEEHNTWENSWKCHKCGTIFLP